MNKFIHFFAILMFASCTGPKTLTHSEKKQDVGPKEPAQAVVDSAIEAHGGALYEHFNAQFDFRGKHVMLERRQGLFNYKSIFENDEGRVIDELNNAGFYRSINAKPVELDEVKMESARNAVNSLVYFTLLPHGLNDGAVIKEYLGKAVLDKKKYHKVKVTFKEEGGGKDFQDVFVYWFEVGGCALDYLAYYYHTNEGGGRFRKAYNRRNINGLVFQDYINYSSPAGALNPLVYDSLFDAGLLKKVSVIETGSPRVNVLTEEEYK